MPYGSCVVRSKSGVIVRGFSGRDSGLDWGVGELLVGKGQARINEGCQLMIVIYEEHLYVYVCTEIACTCKYW